MNPNTFLELHFPLSGTTCPSDNGFPLYSAVCKKSSELHAIKSIAIHTLRGMRTRRGIIRLIPNEFLRVRLPAEYIPQVYKLAGAKLDVGGHQIRCGVPTVHMLKPASRLRARLVVIKSKFGLNDHSTFLEAANRQLRQLDIAGNAQVERDGNTAEEAHYARRVLSIHNVVIPGYGLIVDDLSESDSIKLQSVGLGGRRHMGAGIFVPVGDDTDGRTFDES